MPVGTRSKGGGGLRPVLGTWIMQTDQAWGRWVFFSYIFDQKRRERGRSSCSSRISLSLYMTGEVEAVMRRSGEARRERPKKFCLHVCLFCLLAYVFFEFTLPLLLFLLSCFLSHL
jgi:hypothetical protein